MTVPVGRSRYEGIEIVTSTVHEPNGDVRQVRHLRRRLPPEHGPDRPLAVHRISAGDRLDLVTHRHLGDALAFWQVADANTALDPDGLLAPWAEGGFLVIPVPGV
ncbi:hypothetical protein ACFYNL_05865 [Streptomyces sp. NPDC007808]|uniref:hypothetical protein n=1 Tax=Streptomyces sp. NPDC007808 TaxID=3364779 RepID=UPI0036A94BD4